MDARPKLLWIDGGAALVGGMVVLLSCGWLAKWYELPRALILTIGLINLAYASFSLSLAARKRRPKNLIAFLVIANLSWAVVCLALAFIWCETVTFFGFIHLIGEAIFVTGLASSEWRWRALLLTAK